MTDHDLLTSQRNQVFNEVQQVGLEPASFRWARVPSLRTADLFVPRLVHVASGGYYHFDLHHQRHWCQYSPGEDTLVGQQYPGDWPHQFSYAQQWLRRLKREIETPDLWTVISGEAALMLGASVPGDSTNTPFSPSERERLSRSLNEIREYLVSTQQLSGARLAFVEDRLRYLEEAAGRMGRKDWINVALGALVNIVVGVALAPDAAKDLIRLAGSALAWVLGEAPALPP